MPRGKRRSQVVTVTEEVTPEVTTNDEVVTETKVEIEDVVESTPEVPEATNPESAKIVEDNPDEDISLDTMSHASKLIVLLSSCMTSRLLLGMDFLTILSRIGLLKAWSLDDAVKYLIYAYEKTYPRSSQDELLDRLSLSLESNRASIIKLLNDNHITTTHDSFYYLAHKYTSYLIPLVKNSNEMDSGIFPLLKDIYFGSSKIN